MNCPRCGKNEVPPHLDICRDCWDAKQPLNDGGPAFPNKDELGNMVKGMTLRDYFAAAALQGLLAAGNTKGAYSTFAEHAYAAADAMLAARKEASRE